MMGLVKSPKDFWAALIYIVLGVVVLYVGADYRMGTAGRMGPGYFPKVLAWLLIGIGVIAVARSVYIKGEPVSPVVWLPLLLAIGALGVFAWAFMSGGAKGFSMLLGTIGGPNIATAILAIGCLVGAVVSPPARPLLLILLACGLFGWLLPRAGLGVALIALCMVSAAASREFRFDINAALGLLALVVVCVAVFVKGLGVPMPLWGTWLEPYVGGLPAWMR